MFLGKNGYPYAKDWNWSLISNHIEKSTQNRLGAYLKVKSKIKKALEENLLDMDLAIFFGYDTKSTNKKKQK